MNPPMRIDAHQHFWNYSADEYPWISPGTPLQQNWLPADLEVTARPLAIEGFVAVQARQSLEEVRWLVELADESSFIKGVVGWVDLRKSEKVADELAPLASHPKFVGVRHVVQAEPDSAFMLEPDFLPGNRTYSHSTSLTICCFFRTIPAAIQVARQFPEQPFVLDHIAKPVIRAGLLQPWKSDLRELAKLPNVWCKVSGLITEAKMPGWRAEDFRPYLDVVVEAFGADRLMFGSDWPVCLPAGGILRANSWAGDDYLLNSPKRLRGRSLAKMPRGFMG